MVPRTKRGGFPYNASYRYTLFLAIHWGKTSNTWSAYLKISPIWSQNIISSQTPPSINVITMDIIQQHGKFQDLIFCPLPIEPINGANHKKPTRSHCPEKDSNFQTN